MCPFPNAKMADSGGELNSYHYFRLKIKSNYVETFLPSVVIEKGRSVTLTKYLNRISPGLYHVGFDVVKEQIQKNILDERKQADLNVSQLLFERGLKVYMAEKYPDLTA